MSIHMIGTDHSIASVDVRAVFSFTKKNMAESLQEIVKEEGILGAVLLSTCNRMELYVNAEESVTPDLLGLVCRLKGVDPEKYRGYLKIRRERRAVEHLFYLTCGLKSRILAEDQILTQVKNALSFSREYFCTDHVLEVLFRGAVTAAKKVKTEVAFTHANQTAMDQAIRMLKEKQVDLNQAKCMVIGNGEMGKLCSAALVRAGADVTVTIRQYRSGVVTIPQGCSRINYGDRMELLPSCKVVVSATSSPNFTLRPELFEGLSIPDDIYLIDLAVPRDIDPALSELEHAHLYTIDDFKITESEQNEDAYSKASVILSEEMLEFYRWYEGIDLVPRVMNLEAAASYDIYMRLAKNIRKHEFSQEEEKILVREIDTASRKVVNKILFSLKNELTEERFSECLDILENAFKYEIEEKEKQG